MNQRKVQAAQQGNTMQIQELAAAKNTIKALQARIKDLEGKPKEEPKAPPPPPKTKDIVMASNKALREAVGLLRRADKAAREALLAPLFHTSTPVSELGDTGKLFVQDIPAFLALDLDKTISASPVQAQVVRRAPQVTVIGKPPAAGIQSVTVQPQGAPPVVK